MNKPDEIAAEPPLECRAGYDLTIPDFLRNQRNLATERRESWTADRQAELMMAGMSKADALRRAMEDWHTYKVPNK